MNKWSTDLTQSKIETRSVMMSTLKTNKEKYLFQKVDTPEMTVLSIN
jgi:hypothetical protein